MEINGKTYTIKEIKYKDAAKLSGESKEDAAKQMILLGTGMSEEEYNDLSMLAGVKLQTAINKINGLTDFQPPL